MDDRGGWQESQESLLSTQFDEGEKNNFHKVLRFQVFLSDTNNLYTIMISSKISYLIIVKSFMASSN